MKQLLFFFGITFLWMSIGRSQVVSTVDKIIISDSLRLRGYSVSDISNDTTIEMRRQRALMTEWAVKNYVGLHGGGSNMPLATSSILGGVKIGSNMTINPDSTLTTNNLHVSPITNFTYVGSDNGTVWMDTTYFLNGSPKLAPVVVGHGNLKNMYFYQNNNYGMFWTWDRVRQPATNPVVVGNDNLNQFTNSGSWGNYFPTVVVGSNNVHNIKDFYNLIAIGSNIATNAVMDSTSATRFGELPGDGAPMDNPDRSGYIGFSANTFIGNNIGVNSYSIGSNNTLITNSWNNSSRGNDPNEVYNTTDGTGRTIPMVNKIGDNNLMLGGWASFTNKHGKFGNDILLGTTMNTNYPIGYANIIMRALTNETGDDKYAVLGDSNFVVGNYTYVQDIFGSRQTNLNNILTSDSMGRIGIGQSNVATPLWADPSASVDLNSPIQGGTKIKVGTSSKRNAIVDPANGLLFYDKTLNVLCVYVGTKWQKVVTQDVD